MTLLEKIVQTKKEEVARQKKITPASHLERYPLFQRQCISLKAALLKEGAPGIIAEFKQKSPSKGEINFNVKVEEVTKMYVKAGASGLSVLTDFEYFGGTPAALTKARETNPGTPILRKDFIIDPYQVIEAKAFGADVILLIAACLEKSQAEKLAEKAKDLGMEVLMEIHEAEELEKINAFVDMTGINNRNLKTFETDVKTSEKLAPLIPGHMVKVSESGLSGVQTIHSLRRSGFKGFLIGESFMKHKDPGAACRRLIAGL